MHKQKKGVGIFVNDRYGRLTTSGIFLIIFTLLSVVLVMLLVSAYPTVNFTTPTPANGSSQTATSIYVNVSSNTTASLLYTFVDFDRTVKLWLRMDDINSTNGVIDSSSYSTNASNSSRAFQNASGKFNASFTFNGNSSIISLPSYPLQRNESEGFTASLWLNRQPSASGTVYIFEMGALSFALTYEGSSVVCNLRNSTSYIYQTNAAFTPAVSTWYHAVCSYSKNDGVLRLYVNGVQNTTLSIAAFDQFNGPPSDGMGIGCRTPSFCSAGNAWNGSLDEVIVFNRSLNNTEVSALFNATANRYSYNFTSLSAGQHTFTAYAVDNNSNKNQTEQRIVILSTPDISAPVVNLLAPPNGTLTTLSANFFAANFSDDYQLKNSTLYIWNASTLVNTTSLTLNGSNNATNISVTLPRPDTYYWNYYSSDNSSNTAWNASNFTLTYTNNDLNPPSALLISPLNGTVITTNDSSTTANITSFFANFSDNIQLKNVTLSLWNSTGSLILTNTTNITGTSNSTNLSITLPYKGTFFWNYRVSDNSSNTAYNSSNWTVYFSNLTACNDNIDNDGDRLTDWQQDLGCYGASDTSERAGNLSEKNGWTTFDRSSDALVVFVSNTTGNDSWSGYSPEWNGTDGPKKNLSTAYALLRNGYPDWLLLKRGDKWYNESFEPWGKSGRGASEMMVMGSYGNSTVRPMLRTGQRSSGITMDRMNYTAFVGFELYASARDPSSSDYVEGIGGANSSYDGIIVTYGTYNLLLEDCKISYYASNIIQDVDGTYNAKNITMRRCTIVYDHPGSTGAHSQGMYIFGVDGLLLEENFLYHNGWNEVSTGAIATTFNHNFYLNELRNIIVRNNILLNASCMGTKFAATTNRSFFGFSVINNLYSGDEIGVSLGGHIVNMTPTTSDEDTLAFVDGNITENVLINMGGVDDRASPLSQGIGMGSFDKGIIKNNYLIHQTYTTNTYAFALNDFALTNTQIINNTVYDWKALMLSITDVSRYKNTSVSNNSFQGAAQGEQMALTENLTNISFSGNKYYTTRSVSTWFNVDSVDKNYTQWISLANETLSNNTQITYVSPNRSISTYMASLGESNTSYGGFLAKAINQSRFNWNSSYTADSVNTYIKAGFEIASNANDTTAPSVTLLAPSNGSFVTSNATNFSASFTDDYQLKNATLYLWNSTSLLNTTSRTLNGTSNATNISITLPREGTYFWNYLAADNSSNSAFASSNNSVIFDSTLPIPLYGTLTETNGSTLTRSNIVINVTASDTNLVNITINLFNASGFLNQSNTSITSPFLINYTGLANGVYYFNATATDSANNQNRTETRTVTITTADSTAPLVNITVPSNTTYANASFNFNVSLNEVGTVLFTLTNGATNYTMASTNNITFNRTNSSIRDGSYTFKVYANDSAGNRNDTASVVFSIDTTFPVVNLTYPLNTTYTSIQTALNYTLVDASTQACWYSLNLGATNTTITCGSNVTGLSSSEGSNTWTVYVNDSGGNTNSSTRTFFVDSITPGIQYVSPTDSNGSFVSRRWIIINVTASDTNLANITINLINSTSLVNTTVRATSPNFVNISVAADGVYYFNATALDTLNTINRTETRTIVIDTIQPSVNITYPQNTTYNNAISAFNYSVSDINVQACWYSLNSGATNTTVACGTNITGITSTAGTNIWAVYANDSAGNVNFTTRMTFAVVDTTTPQVTVNTPGNTTYSTSNIDFDVSLDEQGFVQYSLSGGRSNVTMTTTNNLSFTNTNSSIANGNYNFTVYANDSSGNRNDSVRVFFAISVSSGSGSSGSSGGSGGGGGAAVVPRNVTNSTMNTTIPASPGSSITPESNESSSTNSSESTKGPSSFRRIIDSVVKNAKISIVIILGIVALVIGYVVSALLIRHIRHKRALSIIASQQSLPYNLS
ncbi:LamG domain-containing protein [Candidatus Pacearchaeota archaeon]|nr:LamG domain-containing protein [Candidatus Pacearchaeota archaeon]